MQRKPTIIFWFIRLLTVTAIGLSTYLTWVSISGSSVPGCGFEGLDCAHVLATRWSKLFGIPVSIVGLTVYVGLFIFSWFIRQHWDALIQQIAWYALIVLALLAFIASIWFTSLQFVVGSFCLYCLLTHLCGIVIAVLVFWSVPWQVTTPPTRRDTVGPIMGTGVNTPLKKIRRYHGIGRLQAMTLGSLAGVVASMFVAGQLFSPHETMNVETLTVADSNNTALDQLPSDASTSTQSADDHFPDADPPGIGNYNHQESATHEKVTNSNNPQLDFIETKTLKPVIDTKRFVRFFPNAPALDVSQRPVVGDRHAPHLIMKIMDYTCKHCRELHTHLEAVRRRYGDQIAFVIVPIALSTKCNKYVKKQHKDHEQACRYVQLALGVWQAEDGKFSIFHDYLMANKHIPPLGEAAEFAKDLVGDKTLRRNIKSPIVLDIMQEHHDWMQFYVSKGLPTMFVGNHRLQGIPQSNQELFNQLEKLLSIQPIEIGLTKE